MIPYKSAAALEMAIKAAAKASGQDTNKAIVGFYRHRLLSRVFLNFNSPFVLKGGLGLLARTLDARYTRDIDLTTSELGLDEAIQELNTLVSKDMGDFISFVPNGCRIIKAEDEYRDGYTVSYDVYLGTKKVQTVSVDLVSDRLECNSIDFVVPADRIKVAGFDDIAYPVYPADNAVADKFCGIIERHGDRPSSRTKDLVDIVVYALTVKFENRSLSAAIKRELGARRIPNPGVFSLPEEWTWTMEPNYRKAADLSNIPDELKSMAAAEHLAAALFSLPLSDPESGALWDTESLSWRRTIS